jgi:hypothetical protein
MKRVTVGRHVEPEPAVRRGDTSGQKAFSMQVARALDGIDAVAIVPGGARRQRLTAEPCCRLDDFPGHRQAMLGPTAGRLAVTHRQVSIWCSSIMFPNGS